MRVVGFIPSRLNSERLPAKNIKELGGEPLINYTVRTLNRVPEIDDVAIFASEPSICGYIRQGLSYSFVERSNTLDTQQASIQDLIDAFLQEESAQIIVLLHVTSPFLRPETVSDCIQKVASGEYDSAFTAYEMRKFCWFRGQPLNYSLTEKTPRTQDIDPVLVEQSSLYVFRREVFEASMQRVGRAPYIKIIDHFEGHDIDTPDDFRIAELIVNTGYFGG